MVNPAILRAILHCSQYAQGQNGFKHQQLHIYQRIGKKKKKPYHDLSLDLSL